MIIVDKKSSVNLKMDNLEKTCEVASGEWKVYSYGAFRVKTQVEIDNNDNKIEENNFDIEDKAYVKNKKH